jgi:hypothetical protein
VRSALRADVDEPDVVWSGIERFEAITTALPALARRWQVLLWKIRKVGAGHTSSIDGYLARVERCFPAAAPWARRVGFENSPIAIYL